MKTSEQLNELADALSQAQGEFPEIVNNQVVDFKTKKGDSINYSYAEMSYIVELVRPILSKNGLSVIQPLGTMGDDSDCLRTRLLHKSGQYIEDEINLKIPRDKTIQDQGKIISFMKRQAYIAMLGVTTKDPAEGVKPKKPVQKLNKQGSVVNHTRKEETIDSLISELRKVDGAESKEILEKLRKMDTKTPLTEKQVADIKKIQEDKGLNQ